MMRLLAVVSIALGVVWAAGCTAEPPDPLPDKTGPPRPTEAPAVAKVLDLKRYEGKPCDLLTVAQRASLELPPLSYQGPFTCEFEKAEPRVRVTFQLFPDSDVLGRAYLESNEEKWERFEAATVAGQPAVVHSFDPHTTCEVVVGTGQGQGMTVNASGSDRTVDWCAKAVAAASFVGASLAG